MPTVGSLLEYSRLLLLSLWRVGKRRSQLSAHTVKETWARWLGVYSNGYYQATDPEGNITAIEEDHRSSVYESVVCRSLGWYVYSNPACLFPGQIISVMERMRKAQLTTSFLTPSLCFLWINIICLAVCHQLQCRAHKSCHDSSQPFSIRHWYPTVLG